jgi:DNA repair ATPase RecN
MVGEPKVAAAEASESPASENNILSQIAGMQSTLAAFSNQFDKLTNIVQRLDLMEDKIRRISKTVEQISNDENLQSEQVTEIKTRLREYQKSKSELKDKFQCGACNSKGHMAFAVKCTVCGKEEWFGWWPKKQ